VLDRVDDFAFGVHFSPGSETRARMVAQRMERAVTWLDKQVGLPSVPSLFVLNPEHWNGIAPALPYGMPHVQEGRIVVGQRAAPFWQTLIDVATPHLLSRSARRLTEVYGDPLDLGDFADLLVVHELGHVTHDDSWPGVPVGFWLNELAANLCLHGYVVEEEPESRPILETVVEVIWHGTHGLWPVEDLERMPEVLTGDGTNYVWFQFGLQILARRLWDSAGETALQTIIGLLRGPARSFEEVAEILGSFDRSVGRAVISWPHLQ
jgi:hypothetical protein